MIDWAKIAEAAIPIVALLVVFGAPALYLWIVRETRFRTKQLELAHDQTVAQLQRERDVLEAKVTQMEPELEFLRQVVRGDGVRARIATLPQVARHDGELEPVSGEDLHEDPLPARLQTR